MVNNQCESLIHAANTPNAAVRTYANLTQAHRYMMRQSNVLQVLYPPGSTVGTYRITKQLPVTGITMQNQLWFYLFTHTIPQIKYGFHSVFPMSTTTSQ